MDGSNTLAIGIDFGAKFTKVSWRVVRSSITNINHVNRWLSTMEEDANRYEVPSRIHYNEDTDHITWGYNIPVSCKPIEWLPIHLLMRKNLPTHLQNSKEIMSSYEKIDSLGKPVVQVVGDFLGKVFEHTMEVIERQEGAKRVKAAPVLLLFAVPPMFIGFGYAVDNMRLAATHGGLLKRNGAKTAMEFISEAHIVAHAIIPAFRSVSQPKTDDTVILMDVGGGIVNMTTVQLLEGNNTKVLHTSGVLGGAAFADKQFEGLLKNTLGPTMWKSLSTTDIQKMISSQWEHDIKRNFDGSAESLVVDLPDRASMGQLSIKSCQIRAIFDKVISSIVRVFESHLTETLRMTTKAPKTIILFGGFSQTPYVSDRIKATFGNYQVANHALKTVATDVLHPRGQYSLTVVSEVAALFGRNGIELLKAPTTSRISRFNYTVDGNNYTSSASGVSSKPFHRTIPILAQGEPLKIHPAKYGHIRCHWPVKATGVKTIWVRIKAYRIGSSGLLTTVASMPVKTPAPVETFGKVLKDGEAHYEYVFKIKYRCSGEEIIVRVATHDDKVLGHKIVVPITYDINNSA
ncbi:hypothetical protein F5Y05DRAFT_423177 [Hypoxylon sp. FL0543]|nr:hypothetical protein F5Y05DRAFT_423177 [Hypoxylon sp. FL0543]